jgi:hypothetical protein
MGVCVCVELFVRVLIGSGGVTASNSNKATGLE